MNTTPTPGIELLIRTDALRKILNDDPDTRLKLQSMACEKIAEELKRKASNMAISQFEPQIQSITNKAIADCNMTLASKYKFPAEAKAIIEELAKENVQTYFKAEIKRWEATINEFFAAKQAEANAQTEAKVMETIEKMRPLIRQQAREEFIATLEAVQGAK